MELVKKILPYTILIGVISFVMISIFDSNNGLLQPKVLNGITIYVFDLKQHLTNISEASDLRPVINTNIFPTREWNTDVINDIAVAFNWLYMPINALLLPVRFSAWITRLLFTVFGVANDNVIMGLLTDITTRLIIPYI